MTPLPTVASPGLIALAATPEFAMSLNAAFGGANTALVIGLP